MKTKNKQIGFGVPEKTTVHDICRQSSNYNNKKIRTQECVNGIRGDGTYIYNENVNQFKLPTHVDIKYEEKN